MDLYLASNNFYSFFWDLVSALSLGLLFFLLGALFGWWRWKDRLAEVRQAPRANESLRKDIERLEAEVETLENA